MTFNAQSVEKIFVSSTCYDLLDLRIELAKDIESLGLTAILSDVDNGHFEVGSKDSINTCLTNVRSADLFVCIVSQRYGPKLGRYGFEDLSATHLEYRTAKSEGKQIEFYVRDRTMSELDLYKASKRAGSVSSFKSKWVSDDDCKDLFEFIIERQVLTNGGDPNWIRLFSNSCDLKSSIRSLMRRSSKRAQLARMMELGHIPAIQIRAVKCDAQNAHYASFILDFSTSFGVAIGALLVEPSKLIGDLSSTARPINVTLPYVRTGREPTPSRLALRYMTPTGFFVVDTFEFAESNGLVISHMVARELQDGTAASTLSVERPIRSS